jgi:hypothetical protein
MRFGTTLCPHAPLSEDGAVNDFMYRYQLLIILFVVLSGCLEPSAVPLRDGDIIFQSSRSSQSTAIEMATGSKYSHVGILFFQGDRPYVFEAARTVLYTPLDEWIDRGEGGYYVVKRLRDADRLLTGGGVSKLKEAAAGFQGKPYDLTFGWSDHRIYCSELVWKIYDRGLGVQVGQLKKLRDFDLSGDVVKSKMKERYGDEIPLGETVISPGDMFLSDLLMTVSEH